jgi:hypothetical protein
LRFPPSSLEYPQNGEPANPRTRDLLFHF